MFEYREREALNVNMERNRPVSSLRDWLGRIEFRARRLEYDVCHDVGDVMGGPDPTLGGYQARNLSEDISALRSAVAYFEWGMLDPLEQNDLEFAADILRESTRRLGTITEGDDKEAMLGALAKSMSARSLAARWWWQVELESDAADREDWITRLRLLVHDAERQEEVFWSEFRRIVTNPDRQSA